MNVRALQIKSMLRLDFPSGPSGLVSTRWSELLVVAAMLVPVSCWCILVRQTSLTASRVLRTKVVEVLGRVRGPDATGRT